VPVTIEFTLSSGIALLVLLAMTREFWRDRQAMVTGKKNGAGLAMATLLLVAIGGLTLGDAMLFVTGVASLAGVRILVFIIVGIPVVNLAIGLWIYRLRGQVRSALRELR
jgi:hypothetical protein